MDTKLDEIKKQIEQIEERLENFNTKLDEAVKKGNIILINTMPGFGIVTSIKERFKPIANFDLGVLSCDQTNSALMYNIKDLAVDEVKYVLVDQIQFANKTELNEVIESAKQCKNKKFLFVRQCFMGMIQTYGNFDYTLYV